MDAVILQVRGRLLREGIWLSSFHMHMVELLRINRCLMGDCQRHVRDVEQLLLWKLLWPVAPSVVEYMPYHHPAVEIRPISNLQVLAISYNDKRVYLKAKITIWEEIILAPVYLISTMLLAQEASPASRHVAWQQRASDPVQVVS